MERDTISAALGSEPGTAALLEGWETSQASLPEDGTVFFLAPAYVAAASAEAGLHPGLAAALSAAAECTAATPAARALAWHAYHRLKERPQWGPAGPAGWPLPTPLVGDAAALFYLQALLGELPVMRAIHAAHGVPEAIYRATLGDIQRWCSHYHHINGTWGMTSRHLAWYWLHLHGELYEVGRLQYQPGAWRLPVHAYRHTTTGAVVALSGAGVSYRADGQRDGAGGVRDPAGAWTAQLAVEPEAITGHRILPVGCVERAVTRLPRPAWHEVLAPGTAVLSLHIPQGAPLDLEACGASLADARGFFTAHFADAPFVAFACHSWLLDAQLAEVLPPTSNLVRFQRQMYLVPTLDDGRGAFFFCFDDVPTDLRQAPRDTTLRRALVDHVLGGGHWRSGGCFLLPEDLPRWGTDTYREQSDA